ncbi:hypothetical protein N7471_002322 [Penicillium samsonianum]|uniref:uncharacterized protein n=1 Tax=Penicillium samsonianum TaxID=1882272 RepID=UPI002547AE5D|nr:uncharacterized protein N7471_002322 [Penicillium samsonianum]KAJ6142869.1 hypothetical protein N7471_002322 [Penicillium samsonianum]
MSSQLLVCSTAGSSNDSGLSEVLEGGGGLRSFTNKRQVRSIQRNIVLSGLRGSMHDDEEIEDQRRARSAL